jgi:hypothetical protein
MDPYAHSDWTFMSVVRLDIGVLINRMPGTGFTRDEYPE